MSDNAFNLWAIGIVSFFVSCCVGMVCDLIRAGRKPGGCTCRREREGD